MSAIILQSVYSRFPLYVSRSLEKAKAREVLALSQDRQPTHESFTSVDMEIDSDLAKLSLGEEPVLDAGGVPFSQPLDPFPATQPDTADHQERPKLEDPATTIRGQAIKAVLLRPRTVDMLQNQGLQVASPEKKPQQEVQTIATPARSHSNAPLLEGGQDAANAVQQQQPQAPVQMVPPKPTPVAQQTQVPVPSQDASQSAPVPEAPQQPQQLNVPAPSKDAAQSAPVPKAIEVEPDTVATQQPRQQNVPAPSQDARQSAPVPTAMEVDPAKLGTHAVAPQQPPQQQNVPAPSQDATQSAPVPLATSTQAVAPQQPQQLNVAAPSQDASQSAPVPKVMDVEPSTDTVATQQPPQQQNVPAPSQDAHQSAPVPKAVAPQQLNVPAPSHKSEPAGQATATNMAVTDAHAVPPTVPAAKDASQSAPVPMAMQVDTPTPGPSMHTVPQQPQVPMPSKDASKSAPVPMQVQDLPNPGAPAATTATSIPAQTTVNPNGPVTLSSLMDMPLDNWAPMESELSEQEPIMREFLLRAGSCAWLVSVFLNRSCRPKSTRRGSVLRT